MNIFELQKKVIRIITGIRNRNSRRDYLKKKIKILPLQSKCLLSILMFVVQNMNWCKSNTEVHTNNTRHSIDLYIPSPKLTYQRGTFCMGVRISNSLLFEIKSLTNNVNSSKQP
jgi:hypothetical protein